MIQGVCVDSGQSVSLRKGKTYFLFPNGIDHYYVSEFPSQNAHRGCFQSRHFRLVERDVWPPEPAARPIYLDSKKVYKAVLIWRKPGYKSVDLKEYYIKPRSTHADFYHDNKLRALYGCFPIHWFTNFEEIPFQINNQKESHIEMNYEKNEPFFSKSVHEFNDINHYEQLTLF